MPSREDLQWIIIDDFTPGIVQPRVGAAQPAPHLVYFGYGAHKTPLGAAQVNGTYGCVASPSGALVPAPGLDYTMNQARVSTGTYPAGENRDVVLATHMISPVWPSLTTGTTPPASNHPDELFVMFGTFHDPASGAAWNQRLNIRQYKMFAATTPTAAPPTVTPFGPIVAATGAGGVSFVAPFLHARADFCNTVGISTVSITQVAIMYALARTSAVFANIYLFPNLTTPNLDNVVAVTNPQNGGWLLCGHQGRVLVVDAMNIGGSDGENFGAAAIIPGANDVMYYPPRNAQTGGQAWLSRPVEEIQSTIRTIASVNASELFMVKTRGGGVVITGDLANPTVKHMPGLASTGNVYCKPVNTPSGLFYAGREGVYVWTGNDVSSRVSQQLDGGFWIPSDSIVRSGLNGQLEYIEPWILAPNNYMYDTRFGSWWRLTNVRTFFSYHASSNGGFWAIPGFIDDANPGLAYHFDPLASSPSYSWTSQPMTPIPAHMVEIRDLVFMVEGHGAVSIIGTPSLKGEGSITESIQFNVTTPTVIRVNVRMVTESITLQLVVTSWDNVSPAPTVHGVRIGYEPQTQHPSNN